MSPFFGAMSDEELERRLKALVAAEREQVVDVLLHLAEFDRRSLPMQRAHASLWKYCTTVLKYSEKEAWYRVQASRVASRAPTALEYLRSGRIPLCSLALLNAHLNGENAADLLSRAADKSFRELEALLAGLAPKADKPDRIRTLSVAPPAPPTPQTVASEDLSLFAAAASPPLAAAAPASPDGDRPLPAASEPTPPPAEVRVYFSFTGSLELRKKVDRAAQILWHSFPDGRLEDLVGAALDDLLERRDPDRKKERRAVAREAAGRDGKAQSEPRKRSRHIPVWVKSAVWKRDQGCCAFTTSDGVRCAERSGLQYDHVIPFALGGSSDDPSNIRLLCFTHNQMLARHAFGDDWRAEGEAAAGDEAAETAVSPGS